MKDNSTTTTSMSGNTREMEEVVHEDIKTEIELDRDDDETGERHPGMCAG